MALNKDLLADFEQQLADAFLSCGSASLCVASNFLSKKDDLITVKTFGGEIIFKKIKDAILMKGPTTFIYKGNINE